MKKWILGALLLIPQLAYSGFPIIYGSRGAQNLTDVIQMNQGSFLVTSTIDPTVTAFDAPKGSILMRYGASGGKVYEKTDNGLSTNWSLVPNLQSFSAVSPIQYNNTTGVFSLSTVPTNLGGTGQDFSATSGIIHLNSGTMSASPIVDADVDPTAAISRSKLANGSANEVVINSGAGVLSSEPQLATSRGGTGQDFSASTGVVHVAGGTMSATTVGLGGSDVSGTLPINHGGTGQITAAAALDALSPLSALGDTVYFDGTNHARVAGNTTAGKQFYSQTGTGAASAAPAWSLLSASDIPSLDASKITTGQLPIGNGGTGQATKTAAFDALSPNSTLGDLTFHNGTNNVRLAGNTSSTIQVLSQTGTGAVSAAPTWHLLDTGDIQTGVLGVARGGVGGSFTASTGLLHYSAGSTSVSAVNLAGADVTGTLPNGNTTGTAADTASTLMLRDASKSTAVGQILLDNTGGTGSTDAALLFNNSSNGTPVIRWNQTNASGLQFKAIGAGANPVTIANDGSMNGFIYITQGGSELRDNSVWSANHNDTLDFQNSAYAFGFNSTDTATAFTEGYVAINNSKAGNPALVVRGKSGQTADLQDWQTSTPTTVASISSAGDFTAQSINDKAFAVGGVVHNDSTGHFTSSSVVAGDMSSSAATYGQLATADGAGGVFYNFRGSPSINYMGSDYGFEQGVNGAVTYADGAATPVDLTGGSPTLTAVRSTSSPLRGTGSLLITAGTLGDGVEFPVTIDTADQARMLSVQFDYNETGTVADGDFTVWIYDVTNAVLIQPAPYKIPACTANCPPFQAVFQSASNSTSYRVGIHQAVASSATLKIDNISVGPQIKSYGPAMSDFKQYTLSIGATTTAPTKGTVAYDLAYWRQVGDSMEITYNYNQTGAGANGSGTYLFPLPSGYSIDTTKMPTDTSNARNAVGQASVGDNLDADTKDAYVVAYNSTNLALAYESSGTTPTYVQGANANFGLGNTNQKYSFTAKVPIAGWSSTTLGSNDAGIRRLYLEYTNSDGRSVTASTTDLSWTNKQKDNYAAWQTDHFVAPFSDWYSFTGTAQFNSSITGDIIYYVNGTQKRKVSATDASNTIKRFSGSVYLNQGDSLSFRSNTSGAQGGDDLNANLEISSSVNSQQIAASESVLFRGKSSAGTSILNGGTLTQIPLVSTRDDHSAWSGSVFTAPMSGNYAVGEVLMLADNTGSGNITCSTTGTFQVQLRKYVSGSPTAVAMLCRTIGSGGAALYGCSGSDTIQLLQGDQIDIAAANSCGANGALYTDGTFNHATIYRVGNY